MVGNDDVTSMYAIGLGRAWEGAWEGVFFLSLSLTYTHIRTFIYAAVRSIAVGCCKYCGCLAVSSSSSSYSSYSPSL